MRLLVRLLGLAALVGLAYVAYRAVRHMAGAAT